MPLYDSCRCFTLLQWSILPHGLQLELTARHSCCCWWSLPQYQLMLWIMKFLICTDSSAQVCRHKPEKEILLCIMTAAQGNSCNRICLVSNISLLFLFSSSCMQVRVVFYRREQARIYRMATDLLISSACSVACVFTTIYCTIADTY